MAEFGDDISVNGMLQNGSEKDEELAEAKRDLEKWKLKLEIAEDKKSRLVLEKLDTDESKRMAQKEIADLNHQMGQCQEEVSETKRGIQDDISKLERGNQALLEKLKKCQAELQAKKAESATLQQRFKIYAQLPEKKVKFTKVEIKEGEEDSDQHIKGVFTITQKPSVLLKGGQALITFEEEKVAAQILKMARCLVTCDNAKVHVKPESLILEPSVKFEVHIDVFKKAISFSNAPPTIAEERMRDRLEISFSKPSRGGGEVERVDYDPQTGTGKIIFLNTGVAESLSLKRKYCMDVDREVNVNIGPVYNFNLRKFQTFCGALKRTVLLCDIDDVQDEEDLQDHLEIHFQKPSNYGGEVECIRYLSSGKKLRAFFSEDTAETEA